MKRSIRLISLVSQRVVHADADAHRRRGVYLMAFSAMRWGAALGHEPACWQTSSHRKSGSCSAFQPPGTKRVARECREPMESTGDFENRGGRRRRPRSGALDGGDKKQSTSNSDADTAQSRIIAQLRLRPPVQTEPISWGAPRAPNLCRSALT